MQITDLGTAGGPGFLGEWVEFSGIASSGPQKIVHGNSGFAENGAERSLRHVAGMMRDRNFAAGLRMTPNLVTACATAVEAKTERA